MGAKIRKPSTSSHPLEDSSGGSSSAFSASCPTQSSIDFYNEFKKELSAQNIQELQVLFSTVSVETGGANRCLRKYIGLKEFRRVFKTEMEKYGADLKTQRDAEDMVSESLKSHCAGVISTHLDIMDNINNADAIEDILKHTATSHSCISNIQSNFKLHDLLLQNCLREEFGKYLHHSTHHSLKKYMLLINRRLQYLTQECSRRSSDSSDVSNAMVKQKQFVRRSDKYDRMKLIYGNPVQASTSLYSLIDSFDPPVFPGTSSARPPIQKSNSNGKVL